MAKLDLDEYTMCTECGDVATIIVLGNGDPKDDFDGPWAGCDHHLHEYLHGDYEPGVS